jgi:hypothetical protein
MQRSRCLQRCQARGKFPRRCVSFGGMATHLPDQAQQARHVVELGGLRVQHGQAHFFQAMNVCGTIAADPDNDQVRFQRQDAFEVDAAVVADARQCSRHGIIAGAVHPTSCAPAPTANSSSVSTASAKRCAARRAKGSARHHRRGGWRLPAPAIPAAGTSESDAANHRSTRAA